MNIQAMQDMDTFRQAKADYYQGKLTREDAEAAARKVLENQQAAARKLGKKPKAITASEIAKMFR